MHIVIASCIMNLFMYIISPGRRRKMGYLQYVLNKAYREGIAASGTLELTGRCNLSCKMCYIHRAENDADALAQELPTEFWLDMVRQTRQAGTLTMLITGGEPLLRRDFHEIYLACKQAGFLVSVNTNGSLLQGEDVAFFAHYPPVRLNVSLYGASAQTYERLCGNGDIYYRVTENIRKLRAAGVPVKLSYTITPYNRDDAAAVFAFGREVGAAVRHTTYLFPPVRVCGGNCGESVRLDPREAAECDIFCTRERLGAEGFARRRSAIANGASSLPEEDEDCTRDPSERIFCRAGTSSYWITYDGRLLPCGMLQEPCVPLAGRTFAEAWCCVQEATNSILLPAQCTACKLRPVCEVCAAVCYGENGRFDAVPRYLCEKTRASVALYRSLEETE